MVVIILLEALIKGILARNLLGHLIFLEYQVRTGWKVGRVEFLSWSLNGRSLAPWFNGHNRTTTHIIELLLQAQIREIWIKSSSCHQRPNRLTGKNNIE